MDGIDDGAGEGSTEGTWKVVPKREGIIVEGRVGAGLELLVGEALGAELGDKVGEADRGTTSVDEGTTEGVLEGFEGGANGEERSQHLADFYHQQESRESVGDK